jgi:flavin-dependent dehydrogenase
VRESLFAHVTGDQRPAGREEGKVWVCLHPQGAWIWIIPFSNGKTSVGIVAEPEFFKKFSGDAATQLRDIVMSEPNAAARLAKMEVAFMPPRITGYSCGVRQVFGPRYALVGNATEFLDPIFSSGVMLALASSGRAAKVVTRELRGEKVDWQTEYADHVAMGMNTFRAFVSAWYEGVLRDILFSTGKSPEIMAQVCSVLAGYVWDKTNPYATQAERALPLLLKVIQARARSGA